MGFDEVRRREINEIIHVNGDVERRLTREGGSMEEARGMGAREESQLGEDLFNHVIPVAGGATEAVQCLAEPPVSTRGGDRAAGGGLTITTSSSGRVGLQKAFLQSPCLARRRC